MTDLALGQVLQEIILHYGFFDDSSGAEVLVMPGYVDIPRDGQALPGDSLLLVVSHGGQAGGLLDGAEKVVVPLAHQAAGLLQDALQQQN